MRLRHTALIRVSVPKAPVHKYNHSCLREREVRFPEKRKVPSPTRDTVIAQDAEHAGFRHTLHPVRYGDSHDYGTFWGGTEPSACWMGAADVAAAVRHFGFSRVETREEPNPYGKAVAVAAVR